MTLLEDAIQTALILEARSIAQTNVVQVAISYILADQTTRDAFVKAAAGASAAKLQDAANAVDAEAAKRKQDLTAAAQELLDASVDPKP